MSRRSVKSVEKAGKSLVKSGGFAGAYTQRLSKISRTGFFTHKITSVFPQALDIFTQAKLAGSHLMGGLIYTLSPSTNEAKKLNKDFSI